MPESVWNDDEAFEAHIKPAREALAQLIQASEELTEEWHGQVAADSRAMTEIAEEGKYRGESPWDATPAAAAHHLAGILVFGALDHAKAMVTVLEQERAPVYAHIVLARACLEHAAKTWWLLDPQIDVRLRIARSVNERLLTVSQALRLPISDEDKEQARERRADLLKEAERIGFRKAPSRKNTPPALEEQRPSQTDLVRDLLHDGDDVSIGGLVYGYFSAVAHGTLLGLSQSISRDAPNLPQVPGVTMGAVYTGSGDVVTVLTAVILGLGRACLRRIEHLGWSDEEFKRTWLAAIRATGRPEAGLVS
jgi:hypothetical protein